MSRGRSRDGGFDGNSAARGRTAGEAGRQEGGALSATDPLFRISLGEWSYFRELLGPGVSTLADGSFGRLLHTSPRSLYRGEMEHLDFPVRARRQGFDAVEHVNTFFFDRARDRAYMVELRSRCDGEGVASLLILCDSEGAIGAPNAGERARAVENHHKWVEAAAYLGCHSVRVNLMSAGSYEEQQKLAADGLCQLCEYSEDHGVDILVENHGGISSNGEWLAGTIAKAQHPRLGALPDFGNFRLPYDRYKGIGELMPHARAVSAKGYDFDEAGNETTIDYERALRIVLDAGYRGWVGIEYEGPLPADQGVAKAKQLLERLRAELAPEYA